MSLLKDTKYTDAIGTGMVSLFTAQAVKTITNSASETSMIASGVGNLTLPANFLTLAKSIRIIGSGLYSTPLAGSAVTIKVKLGSTVIASVTTTALLSLATNKSYSFEVNLVCYGIGTVETGGNVWLGGKVDYASTAARIFDDLNSISAIGIDTTENY
jgi:hypothetical protein